MSKGGASHPKTIVIVGGGTAGWLTAGLLAAKKHSNGTAVFKVKLIEPTNIDAIGVGEGTWPSMRVTLRDIGVSERDFLKATGASFKQGTKFINWRHDQGEYYYHPFDIPNCEGAQSTDSGLTALEAWKASDAPIPFAQYVGVQETLCEDHRGPKLPTSPDFAGIANYGYHFEADGLARFLKSHCESQLGVDVIADIMVDVRSKENGQVEAILTQNHGDVIGDIFIDCTGFRSLLLKRHYDVQEQSLEDVFLNDRAMVARVSYHDAGPIESTTHSTAQSAGWIWDVGLARRFGVGYVHSSAYIEPDAATETLAHYLTKKGYDPNKIDFRTLKFKANYIKTPWVHNCVAIGLSSGFVEPLEASSIMLTEMAAREIAQSLSADNFNLAEAAQAFNSQFQTRWDEVVHFLKLHYALSQRSDPYWIDSRSSSRLPERLQGDLAAWYETESVPHVPNGLFPTESYQFVCHATGRRKADEPKSIDDLNKYQPRLRQYMRLLPTNRELLNHLTSG